MPHVCTQAVEGFRKALRDTRKAPTVLTFEQWRKYLGANISVCDVNYCVTEDGTPVYGQPFPESSVEIAEQSGCKASLEASTIDLVVDVLQQLTRSADRLSDSLMCCSNNICSERVRVNSEVSEQTSSCENLTENRDAAISATVLECSKDREREIER
eukprot:3504367-Amphidinium_carterae.1